jgi:hypothetical protein
MLTSVALGLNLLVDFLFFKVGDDSTRLTVIMAFSSDYQRVLQRKEGCGKVQAARVKLEPKPGSRN